MSNEPKYVVREIERLYRSLPEEFQKEVMLNLGQHTKIKVYKVLHKPTGLFYKPVKGYDSNLGLSGKVYSKRPSIPGRINIHLRGGTFKPGTVSDIIEKHFKTRYGSAVTPESDWEIIEY